MILERVSPVEASSERPVQLLHSMREIRLVHLQQQVVVVRHQAIRVTDPGVLARHASKEVEEDEVVDLIPENEASPISARYDVVNRSFKVQARRVRHGDQRTPEPATPLRRLCARSDARQIFS
jgi:hypothetical protein